MEKRAVKISYRISEKNFFLRKMIYDQVRDMVGIYELSDADMAEAALAAMMRSEQLRTLVIREMVKVFKSRIPVVILLCWYCGGCVC